VKYFAYILFFFFTQAGFAAEPMRSFEHALLDYNAGRFAAAKTKAQKLGTAEGYALACQTGLVIGGFQEKGVAAVMSLHGAIEDCRRALSLEPTNYSAGVSHAIATGFEGLRLKKVAYARAAKKEIESLIVHFPNNAVAAGALAGWHAAVSRQGVFARLILGAGRDKARNLFSQALKLSGAELPVYFEYIRFLAAGDNQDKSKAESLLAEITAKLPKNALEKLLLEKCLQIQSALQSGSKESLKQTLSAATPFAGIDRWGTVKKTNIKGFPLLQVGSTP